ncbi:mediator of RNA polymerase II transcription subunit 16 [Octopus bimaculoides]|nr:mediator of RNA polymerase II transcription subunit 16 [Octopus bimaculoides]|eukprot:XP_014784264.1 PREDICTED: mediator of RNA polymerase II transcription subunit 16-like [Octopus bimaculoides]
MEVVYVIKNPAKVSSELYDWCPDDQICCSLSCKNILAFSSASDDRDECEPVSATQVQVLDLDKPWMVYKVATFPSQVVNLVWDRNGTHLLIATSEGQLDIWQIKDHMLNKWSCLGEVQLSGEDILSLAWLHNGVLVSVGLIQNTEPRIRSYVESLSPAHLRASLADIAYNANGDLMIATTDGMPSSAIQCFLVSLSMEQTSCVITSRASASLYVKCHTEASGGVGVVGRPTGPTAATGVDQQNFCVTHVQFVNKDYSDTLVICVGGQNFSWIDFWQLVEQTHSLHRMFHTNSKPNTVYKTPKWMHKATVTHNTMVTAIAGPKLPTMPCGMETSGFTPYIAVAYRNGIIKLIHRYSFQVIYNCCVDQFRELSIPEKRNLNHNQPSHLSVLLQTHSSCGMIGVKDNNIYLFRSVNANDTGVQMSPTYIVLLLEYAATTGWDWWDILLATKQSMIEDICQKLNDNFQKQPTAVQELMCSRLLAIKMALYKSSANSYHLAADCQAKLLLYTIATVFKGILRPRQISSQDNNPAEKLSMLCNKSSESELLILLTNLEFSDFLVDAASLQSFQPLIQWIADFTLHLLGSIPLQQSYSDIPGSLLIRDSSVLSVLRELFVIIRLWGHINPNCLPFFTMNSSIECMSHLFKLLTKAWLCVKEGGSVEYEEGLVSDCCHLTSEVMIRNTRQTFSQDTLGYAIFHQSTPQTFQIGVEPNYVYSCKQKQQFMTIPDITTESKQMYDIVRQINLGEKPAEPVRECSRCGAVSLVQSISSATSMKAWEKRWASACLCGGQWKWTIT